MVLRKRVCIDFLEKNMRNKSNKHLGIEIDPELHQKIKYVAEYEGRSINGQILYLIRQCVKKFESENEPIPVSPDDKN